MNKPSIVCTDVGQLLEIVSRHQGGFVFFPIFNAEAFPKETIHGLKRQMQEEFRQKLFSHPHDIVETTTVVFCMKKGDMFDEFHHAFDPPMHPKYLEGYE
jgi:hypothetical protein